MGKRHDAGEAVTIRAAIPGDAVRLADLCEQLGYPAAPADVHSRLEAFLQDEDHGLFVVEGPGGQVAGWVHVFVRRLLMVERHAQVGGLVVDESQRGRGLGRLLMEQAEGWARARGCEGLYVRSNVARERAHRLYRGLGYEQIKISRLFMKKLEGAG
jgi:GNAT superfamily N-acetyltransferase